MQSSADLKLPAIVLLGPPIEHRESLMVMLQGHAARIEWMPDSFSFNRNTPKDGTGAAIARRLDALRGTSDRRYLQLLDETLENVNPDVLIAYWGTIPLADIIAVRRIRPKIKIILMMLCYPLSLEPFGIIRQQLILSLAAKSIDGAICPGPEMLSYLQQKGLLAPQAQMAIVKPCWPVRLHAQSEPVAGFPKPNVIYVGRPDLSGATVHAADDVRPLISELLAAGVEVTHGRSAEMNDGHPLRHQFSAVPIDQLAGIMSRHDASLIVYNLSACKRTERFNLTVPDRLITSVGAGVPIALPRNGYAASRSYLEEYPATILFESIEELKRALLDRVRIEEMRAAAWQARKRYSAESQSSVLVEFLRSVLGEVAVPS